MAKSFEQRLAYLEKLISDFFSGTKRSAKRVTKKSRGSAKRKAKTARKTIINTVKSRKVAKRRRSG